MWLLKNWKRQLFSVREYNKWRLLMCVLSAMSLTTLSVCLQSSSSLWKTRPLWMMTASSLDLIGWLWARWASSVYSCLVREKCFMWSVLSRASFHVIMNDLLVVFQVFEVFGPVSSPLYILRFNSVDQISSKGLTEGVTVYYAPAIKEYTGYILTQQLKL